MSRRVRRILENPRKPQDVSRPPDKYNSNRAVAAEKSEMYCVSYFKSNPDSMDLRPPQEKLDDLFSQLNEDLEPSQRFVVLSQIKTTQYILHGDDSVESLRAHAELGFFYNMNNRPQSALRHLELAHKLERTNHIEHDESVRIAVESAEAHIALKNEKKHVSMAEDCIRPHREDAVEDTRLRYKRDLVVARIFAAKKKYDEALTQYEVAAATLRECNENEKTVEEARLYVEMAETAKRKKLNRRAGLYYKKAYDVYVELGMEDQAKEIEPMLPDEFEEEEEEEEINVQEEEEKGEFQPHPPDHPSRSSRTSKKSRLGEEEEEVAERTKNEGEEEEEEAEMPPSPRNKNGEEEEEEAEDPQPTNKQEEEEEDKKESDKSKKNESEDGSSKKPEEENDKGSLENAQDQIAGGLIE